MKFSDLNKNSKKINEVKKEPVLNENINENLDFKDKSKEETQGKTREVRFSIRREGIENFELKDAKISPLPGDNKEERFIDVKNFDEESVEEKVKNLYASLINGIREIFKSAYEGSYIKTFDLINYISELILKDCLDEPYILNFLRYLTPGDYIYSHSINLSIISAYLAKETGYKEDDIREMAMSALCIDIGMHNYKNLYLLERRLNNDELDIIKNHVQEGINIIEKIFAFEPAIKNRISRNIYLSHERYDASGYYSLGPNDMDEKSQMISIADLYEAMTHKRSYRDAIEEAAVIYSIIKDLKNKFNPKAIKAISMVFGLYPPNSFIKLSTGEIARVVFINRNKPTRPIVKIIADSNFNIIKPFFIDLIDYPLTSIDGWIKFEEIYSNNPKLYREEEIRRLWIDW